MLPVIPEKLYDLREIDLSTKDVIDARTVERESIGRELKPVVLLDSIVERREESVRGFACAFADRESWDQFGISVDRNENPRVPKFLGIILTHMTLLFLDEAPHLVALNVLAAEVPHPRFHQLYATLPSDNEQLENRITVQSRDPLGGPDGSPLKQKLNCQQSFIFRDSHGPKKSGAFLRERLSTLSAPEPRQTVPVPSELLTFAVACRASHVQILQQAIAVCQHGGPYKRIYLHKSNLTPYPIGAMLILAAPRLQPVSARVHVLGLSGSRKNSLTFQCASALLGGLTELLKGYMTDGVRSLVNLLCPVRGGR
jgi:hypothetical protein